MLPAVGAAALGRLGQFGTGRATLRIVVGLRVVLIRPRMVLHQRYGGNRAVILIVGPYCRADKHTDMIHTHEHICHIAMVNA